LTEDRPYRFGMPIEEVARLLEDLARNAKLDAHIVALATRHSDEIRECMLAARQPEGEDYKAFSGTKAPSKE
jgi:HD-GYP domain-containing protein (c-di-GMP phosphodiesterase class II)